MKDPRYSLSKYNCNKVIINGIYGLMGMTGGRLNIPYLSSIITHQSRNLLQSSITYVNTKMSN